MILVLSGNSLSANLVALVAGYCQEPPRPRPPGSRRQPPPFTCTRPRRPPLTHCRRAGNLSFLVLQAFRPGGTVEDPKAICDTTLFFGLTLLLAAGLLN